jgi:ABC-type multidrug transport system fused ATPase/permease subunit
MTMTTATRLALSRGSLWEKAMARAEEKHKALAALDSRVSLARLLGSLVLLGVIAAFFSQWDAATKTLSIFAFALFFAFFSRLHARLQARVEFWKAAKESYQISLWRWQRDFSKLETAQAPWHAALALQVPKGHFYALDLDANKQLAVLLDTAVCPESSQALFERLLSCAAPDGAMRPSQDGVARQARRWVRLTGVQRRVEVFRLLESTKANYHAYKDDFESSLFEKAQDRFQAGLPVTFRLTFAALSIAAWAFLLVPAWAEFFKTAKFEPLTRGLTFYLAFPLLGLALFTPVIEGCKILSRKSTTLFTVFSAMSKANPRSDSANALKDLVSLQRFLSLVELRGNPVLWIFLHLVFPYDAVVAALLEWKAKRILPVLPKLWAQGMEFDLALQLARFAHENPEFHFVEESSVPSGKVVFSATGLGHPALPVAKRVNNDVTFSEKKPFVLLTGSNMAGKSTFLRTLGSNVVLARMGAPVCASAFHSALTTVLCAIRVDDSLEEATSYFYAEVKRLKAVLDHLTSSQTHPFSCLLLVDEIFRGTNNRERFLGSWHVIRALLDTRSFGVVSTHDLALSALEEKDARLVNMHFREHIEEGHLVFDYKLRQGPCPTTNALFIMRHSGLPIPENPEIAHGS